MPNMSLASQYPHASREKKFHKRVTRHPAYQMVRLRARDAEEQAAEDRRQRQIAEQKAELSEAAAEAAKKQLATASKQLTDLKEELAKLQKAKEEAEELLQAAGVA